MSVGIIIVASGAGARMGGVMPKQFLSVGGQMILERTVQNFAGVGDIVVVVPSDFLEFWKGRCRVPHIAVGGGDSRSESVRRGLAAMPIGCDVILVQDGVRPFTSSELIQRVIRVAREEGAVVPAVPITDSLRNGAGAIDRTGIFAVQTPQGFRSEILREGYAKIAEHLSDDASVVEAAGFRVTIVAGETQNIKITTPIDLKIAEILC